MISGCVSLTALIFERCDIFTAGVNVPRRISLYAYLSYFHVRLKYLSNWIECICVEVCTRLIFIVICVARESDLHETSLL